MIRFDKALVLDFVNPALGSGIGRKDRKIVDRKTGFRRNDALATAICVDRALNRWYCTR